MFQGLYIIVVVITCCVLFNGENVVILSIFPCVGNFALMENIFAEELPLSKTCARARRLNLTVHYAIGTATCNKIAGVGLPPVSTVSV